MKTITISTETSETYSSISNFFIDYYMTEANGEFVKVYLYLIRLLSNNTAFTVGEIADHFNLTENDICRAIKYWVSRDVLRLNYDGKGYPTGIVLLPLSRPNEGLSSTADSLSILRKTNEPKVVPKSTSKISTPVEDSYIDDDRVESALPKKHILGKDVMDSLIRNEDWEDLIITLEANLGANLSTSDLSSLYYIHYDLGFDAKLVEYLVDYSFSMGHKKISYIEGIARNWYSDGIRTKEDAKKHCSVVKKLAKKVLKELMIDRSTPTDTELAFIETWSLDKKFSDELILAACKKAMLQNPNRVNFVYINKIIENWYKADIKTMEDVEKYDQEFQDAKNAKKSSSSKVSNFNSFAQTKMNSEMSELEQMLLKEVNS